jgi:hypothetical protein
MMIHITTAEVLDFDTVDAWILDACLTNPAVVRLVRRTLVFVSGWIYRRHEQPLTLEPWVLCALADQRVPEARKSRIAECAQLSNLEQHCQCGNLCATSMF